MATVIGIDVGISGAISVVEKESVLTSIDMPVLKIDKKNKLDEVGIVNFLKAWPSLHIYIEKAQAMPGRGAKCPLCRKAPSQGVVSTGGYLEGFGVLKGICAGLGRSYTLVHPRSWKCKMMKDMGKEKEASIVRVRQLYPMVHLPRKKDHGKADSILIGRYGLFYGD